MVRISHAASYFMPMFCSSKRYIIVLSTMATTLLYISMYLSSHLLMKKYNDPNLFEPNSQDYFRTTLLGIFSPILYYFIKTFLFNINKRYLILNLLIDFPLNDWFILFIIVCLAYPQLEQPKSMQTKQMWHILPRQSYLFGIAWSLGELLICIVGNLFNYQEITPHIGANINGINTIGNENNFYEGGEEIENSDSILPRDKITLSKCMGVRRYSSTISNNVYCGENDSKKTHHHSKNDYGSTRQGENTSNTDETVVMMDPSNNSLRLASLDLEDDISKGISSQKNMSRAIEGSKSHLRYFAQIQNNADLFKGISLLMLVFISNIFLTVGQSLIASIYFIYVPAHEELFTNVVNYFGRRSLHYFLLVIIIPFTTTNLIINGTIYIWKDMNDWLNNSSNSNILAKTYSSNIVNYQDSYETGSSYHRSRPNSIAVQDHASQHDLSSLMILSSPMEYPHYYSSNTDDYDTSSPRILILAKNLIAAWKKLAIKDSFVLTSMFIWGLIVFITGLKSTIKS